MERRAGSRNRGVQAVETAALLLRALVAAERPQRLSEIARASAMPTAKAYRYLVSLARAGLVVQDAATAAYALGPLAHELGHARASPFALGGPLALALDALGARTGTTVCLFRWTRRGATLVLASPRGAGVTIRSRAGAALPLLTTAAGRVFAAFGDTPEIAARVRSERRTLVAARNDDVDALLADAQRSGVARVHGTDRHGVCAIAVPIVTANGLQAVVSAVGSESLDLRPNGRIERTLRAFAADDQVLAAIS